MFKEKDKQQAYVEDSITEAYLEVERMFFTSYYFGSNVPFMRNSCRRNEDGDEHNNHFPTLCVFEQQGTAIGKDRSRYLINAEYIAAHLHVLFKCYEVKPYIG